MGSCNKIIVLLLVTICLASFVAIQPTTVIAQSMRPETIIPTVEWQEKLKLENGTSADSIVQTLDGGYVVAGEGDYKSRSPSYIVKLDSFGNMQWNKSYPQVDFFGVKLAQDGGYAFFGFSFSNDSRGPLILKTDKNGDTQWKRVFKDIGINCMDKTADNGYILAGNNWLVKFNSYGTLEWNATIPINSRKTAYSVIQTNDGGYAVAGTINSSISGKDDFWLAKFDDKGCLKWTKNFDGPNGNSDAYSLIQTGDEGYVLAGRTGKTISELMLDPSPFGFKVDAWIIKTDSLGNILWNKTYNDEGNPPIFYDTEPNYHNISNLNVTGDYAAYSIIETSDRGLAFVGYSPLDKNYGSALIWLVKTDAFGTPQWNITFGDSLYRAQGNALIETSDGGLAIAGFVQIPGFPWIGNYFIIKTTSSLPTPSPLQMPTTPPTSEILNVNLALGLLLAIPILLVLVIIVLLLRRKRNR